LRSITVDSRNRETWASASTWFGTTSGWSDNGEPVALAALAPLVRDQPVLDVGVGGGRTTAILHLLSSDYVAVDYSDEMVDVFRRRYPDAEIHRADARDLSQFDDNRFGLVYFSFNGLDSVDHDGRALVLAEFHRVLRPGGHILFSTLNKTGPAYRGGPWRSPSTGDSLPYRAARFFGRLPFRIPAYAASYRNWWQNRQLHVDHGSWALRTLGAHNYGVVAHFTTLAAELEALVAIGFEPTTTFGDDGRELQPADDLRAINWFHISARKPMTAHPAS
jgi:SAM-dependent methyltransferase